MIFSTIWVSKTLVPSLIKELQEYYDSNKSEDVVIASETYSYYDILRVNGKEIKAL